MYLHCSSHDLTDEFRATGYYGKRIVYNLLTNQVSTFNAQPIDFMRLCMISADHTVSYEWVNAYRESRAPFDFVVRLATPQPPCQYCTEQHLLTFTDSLPLSSSSELK